LLRRLSHRSRHEADAKSKDCDPLELHAAESKERRRRSSTQRRESLCAGKLVLKIENNWASRDFVTVHRLPLAEI
jgi:hypothetical protein